MASQAVSSQALEARASNLYFSHFPVSKAQSLSFHSSKVGAQSTPVLRGQPLWDSGPRTDSQQAPGRSVSWLSGVGRRTGIPFLIPFWFTPDLRAREAGCRAVRERGVLAGRTWSQAQSSSGCPDKTSTPTHTPENTRNHPRGRSQQASHRAGPGGSFFHSPAERRHSPGKQWTSQCAAL